MHRHQKVIGCHQKIIGSLTPSVIRDRPSHPIYGIYRQLGENGRLIKRDSLRFVVDKFYISLTLPAQEQRVPGFSSFPVELRFGSGPLIKLWANLYLPSSFLKLMKSRPSRGSSGTVGLLELTFKPKGRRRKIMSREDTRLKLKVIFLLVLAGAVWGQ